MRYLKDPGGSFLNETRAFNPLLQMTRFTLTDEGSGLNLMDMEYRYPATQNGGRMSQVKDWVSGEEVTYGYDSLMRLTSATTTDPSWSQSYTFDGWGNLTNKNVTMGTAPNLNILVDPTTNRISSNGFGYDANGNLTAMTGMAMSYDVANRVTQAGPEFLSAPQPSIASTCHQQRVVVHRLQQPRRVERPIGRKQ